MKKSQTLKLTIEVCIIQSILLRQQSIGDYTADLRMPLRNGHHVDTKIINVELQMSSVHSRLLSTLVFCPLSSS